MRYGTASVTNYRFNQLPNTNGGDGWNFEKASGRISHVKDLLDEIRKEDSDRAGNDFVLKWGYIISQANLNILI